MKRANRVLQIEMRKRDITGRLQAAIDSGKRPLAFVRKYPAISMAVTALAVGIITRVAVAAPLPAPVKVMAIPLIKRFVSHTLKVRHNTHH